MPETDLAATQALRTAELALARFHGDEGLPGVFAVVPAGLHPGPETQAVIAAMQLACRTGSEIALHGYSHINTLTPARWRIGRRISDWCRTSNGEFAGLSLEEQTRRVVEGKRELERVFGSQICSFVPPWNAYDANTVAACREAGICVLSASRAWPVPSCQGLSFVPQTVTPAELEDAVEQAGDCRDNLAIVCVCHVQGYTAGPSGEQDVLQNWFSRLRALTQPPHVEFISLQRLHEAFGHRLDCRRLRRHRLLSMAARCGSILTGSVTGIARRGLYRLD